jgi:hypothetical protein
VNALHRIHAAVVPGGLVLDMQPVAARPPVETNGLRLGSLDMREWRELIDDVTELVELTIADGLFAEETGRAYEVLETFDDGDELVETVRDWTGTKISHALSARVRRANPPLAIREGVRVRVLRAL